MSGAEDFKNNEFELNLKNTLHTLREEIRKNYDRHVSVGDLLIDRWETANFYGFGEGTSSYNNVLIIGDVKVGKYSWIGPNVILDGSGGLTIGDYVSISAGVQIYTHDTVDWSTSRGQEPIAKSPTKIGDGVYIGPNSVIQKGLTLGKRAIIGAMSFVNCNVPEGAKAFGSPAKIYLGSSENT